jgi:hypothetical protein
MKRTTISIPGDSDIPILAKQVVIQLQGELGMRVSQHAAIRTALIRQLSTDTTSSVTCGNISIVKETTNDKT